MRFLLLVLVYLTMMTPVWARSPSAWGADPETYAFRGATLLVAPGKTIEGGTLLVRGERIEAVGKEVPLPPGTRVFEMSGRLIHAGFLDPYVVASRFEVKAPEQRDRKLYRVLDAFTPKPDSFDSFRELGFVVLSVVPEGGIFRGQSATYLTGDGQVLNPSQASVLGFQELDWKDLKDSAYPMSMMGNVAFIRQALKEAEWYGAGGQPYELELAELQRLRQGSITTMAEAESLLSSLRFLKIFREFGLSRTALVLSGEEWRSTGWLKSALRSGDRLVLPLDFPKDPKAEPGRSLDQVPLSQLQHWFAAPALPRWLAREGLSFSVTTHRLKKLDQLEAGLLEALEAGWEPSRALASLTTEPARLLGLEESFGTLEPGRSASFVVRKGNSFVTSPVEEVWVEGKAYPRYQALAGGEDGKKEPAKARKFVSQADYRSPPRHFKLSPFSPPSVLIRGATLWTQDQQGKLEQADLWVSGGKIQAVGRGLTASPGTHVIEGKGRHVTPGLVDCHSHTAVDGMVNEPPPNVSAMVRMSDVIDPFDHNIYLQLASGVTAAQVLHGSANSIGGQSALCKWRWGSDPEGMLVTGAPGGIKFALGENPKQSNFGNEHTQRYPKTRMGVIESIRGAFATAKNYRAQKNPRPDLALDALVEVLEGKRAIHCHSYRQDEILALIWLAEEEGFRVGTFHHVLEGYKVADEIGAHGASASTFADWWAYKFEVMDAIPYNAALMAERGVNVSINSDSNDLARRLNTEAAKSMRYGGMREVDALNMITRNPARQLGLEQRLGSLTVGKDADFVIWDGPPLSQKAVCLQTWVDGRRYFDRSLEQERVQAVNQERETLLKLLQEGDKK